jgi:VWFA-related protein
LPRLAPGTAALVAVALVFGQPVAWLTVRGQQPTFRTAVDLIAVDVQVLNRDGQPVTTLGPESFEVTLNGQKRRVQWAVFTKYDEAGLSTGPNPASPGPDGLLAPSTAAAGFTAEATRTFIIAIDAGSFRTLDSHVAVVAAQRFIDGLLPTDLVGVFTVPFGPNLVPTADHAEAWFTVGTVVGRKMDFRNPFEFTPAEVIDILAAADSKSRVQLEDDMRRNRRQRFGAPVGSDDQTFSEEVIAKHCENETDASCFDRVISEAGAFALGLESNAMMSIAGLEDLLKLLQSFPGRKTVLLLSGGIPLSDRNSSAPSVGNSLKKMGEQAAYANATVHAIYFDKNFDEAFSAQLQRGHVSSLRSQNIDTRALGEFSAPSGGLLLMSQSGAGEREVDRLLTETSTSYVLGVEPDDRDRDGRAHRIQVKVKQQGTTVRSRQLVVVPKGK